MNADTEKVREVLMKWKPLSKNLCSAEEWAMCLSGEEYLGSKEIVDINMEPSRNSKEFTVAGVQQMFKI